jgi:hypothetical protein
MEEDLYDEFGNYIGPDLNVGDDNESGSGSSRGGSPRGVHSDDESAGGGAVRESSKYNALDRLYRAGMIHQCR